MRSKSLSYYSGNHLAMTSVRGFDGYKGHISIDPDSEIIVATEVTTGNVADGAAAENLLAEVEYNDSGNDAIWFTGDDVVDEFKVYTYDSNNNRILELIMSQQVWMECRKPTMI